MLIERAAIVVVLVSIATASFAVNATESKPLQDCELAGSPVGPDTVENSSRPAFPPVQLDISTPFEPTVFPSGGMNYLVYELHLQNYTSDPMTVRSLEILDARTARPIVAFSDSGLYERILSIGADGIDNDRPLGGGNRAVVFICLAFDEATPVPEHLAHRLHVGEFTAEGRAIATDHTLLKVLAPPVMGSDWVADNGPSLHSHHRTGLFVAGGRAQIARRFAIDWKRELDGATFSGDALNVQSYHSYGERVFAVADAEVVSARDGLPDNVPRTAAGFDTAVPMTMENVAGNAIVLDLGDGQFAYYAHLKPGSVRVKAGDRVKRGDFLAEIGNSGDARWPHLHFQIATGPHILASEGVPFLIDSFRAMGEDGEWQERTREFPLGDIPVEFPVDDPSS